MPDEAKKLQATRILLTAAAVVILVTGLKLGQSFFVPVLLAGFIATVSFPITSWLRKRRVPMPIAVLLTVLVDFAFMTGVVIIVITLTGDLESKWQDRYYPAMNSKIDEVRETAVGVLENLKIPDARKTVDNYATIKIPAQIGKNFDPFDLGKDVAVRVLGFLGSTLLILILTVFMLSEARMFGRRVNAVLEARGPNLDRLMNSTADIQRYLAMKTVVSLATGVLAGFLCWAAGLDFYILWGILAFALNFIPVLGSIIAGVPPFIVAFLVDGGPSALAVGVGYISINIFLGNFLEPMLMGRRFGLSTLVVIISVLFWGFIWGPVGMFLAVPLTMVLKVMLDNSDELRWIAVAITKEKPDSILDLHDLDGSLDGLSSGDRVDLSAVTADKRG
ncbi:MAG: AI-2E family transporter [Akkermansiaceae bacterium]|jgi:AI-2 transport protein TqsA|nr:AI-2E family transporter [Verrucomicrobiota bacterium]